MSVTVDEAPWGAASPADGINVMAFGAGGAGPPFDDTQAVLNAYDAALARIAKVGSARLVYPAGFSFYHGQMPIDSGLEIDARGAQIFANGSKWNTKGLLYAPNVPSGGYLKNFKLRGGKWNGFGGESQNQNMLWLYPGNQMGAINCGIRDAEVCGFATTPFQMYNPSSSFVEDCYFHDNEFGNNGFVNTVNWFCDYFVPILGGMRARGNTFKNSTADAICCLVNSANAQGYLGFTNAFNNIICDPLGPGPAFPRTDGNCTTQAFNTTVNGTQTLSSTVPLASFNLNAAPGAGPGTITITSGTNTVIVTYSGVTGNAVNNARIVGAFKPNTNSFTATNGLAVTNANTVLDPNIIASDAAQWNPLTNPAGMIGRWMVAPHFTSPVYVAAVDATNKTFTLIKSNNSPGSANGAASGVSCNIGVYKGTIILEIDAMAASPAQITDFVIGPGNTGFGTERGLYGVNVPNNHKIARGKIMGNTGANLQPVTGTPTQPQGSVITLNGTGVNSGLDVVDNACAVATAGVAEIAYSADGPWGRASGNTFSAGPQQGTFTLPATNPNQIVVPTAEIRAGDTVRITRLTAGTGAAGSVNVDPANHVSGVSFRADAASLTDNGKYAWEIVH